MKLFMIECDAMYGAGLLIVAARDEEQAKQIAAVNLRNQWYPDGWDQSEPVQIGTCKGKARFINFQGYQE